MDLHVIAASFYNFVEDRLRSAKYPSKLDDFALTCTIFVMETWLLLPLYYHKGNKADGNEDIGY